MTKQRKTPETSFKAQALALIESARRGVQPRAGDKLLTKSMSKGAGSSMSMSVSSEGTDLLGPGDVMKRHGLKESEWELTSFRTESGWKNIKDSSGETETKLINEHYITVKPVKQPDAVLDGWVPIRPATPVNVTFKGSESRKEKLNRPRIKTALILPDPQIGFILTPDGGSWTTHSTEAMSVATQAISVIQPDTIINLGDFFDFAEWSTKYLTPKQLNETTQASLEAGRAFLELQVALCDDVRLIEGNHDARINILLTQRAKQAVGIRAAGNPAG